jgi:hypothetical protein
MVATDNRATDASHTLKVIRQQVQALALKIVGIQAYNR